MRWLLACGLVVWTLGSACSRPEREAPAPAPQVAAVTPAAAEPMRLSGGTAPAQKYFGDTELVDQDGRKVRFYSDLLQGKVVVINLFFASCNGSCPVMAKSFRTIQDQLGDRLGKDVHMISISVDPKDTPEQLHAYSQRVKARPGWYFLTGEKQNVDAVLAKLGQVVKEPTDHAALVFVGNDRTGLWKKAFGLAPAEEVSKIVWSVVNDSGEGEPVQ
jgi:protein SCO1/2